MGVAVGVGGRGEGVAVDAAGRGEEEDPAQAVKPAHNRSPRVSEINFRDEMTIGLIISKQQPVP
jgi:hypothetical protein